MMCGQMFEEGCIKLLKEHLAEKLQLPSEFQPLLENMQMKGPNSKR